MTTPPPVRTPSPVSPALPLSTLATWFFGDWRRSAGFQIYVGVYFVLCILEHLS